MIKSSNTLAVSLELSWSLRDPMSTIHERVVNKNLLRSARSLYKLLYNSGSSFWGSQVVTPMWMS